jgi:Nucleotidyltransferase of unknown function (DUF6036)
LRRFDRSQAISFLHVLDAYLTMDVKVFVVGGMAAMLGYHADVKTADIDVYEMTRGAAEADLQQAARNARAVTGIDLSIGRVSIAELPYDYEDRVKAVRGVTFRKLTVTVPDKYDLILSKALRAYPHDLDAIRSICAHHRCSEKILAKRFETEIWDIANTNKRTFALNMVAVMRVLYGEARAKLYKKQWLGEE